MFTPSALRSVVGALALGLLASTTAACTATEEDELTAEGDEPVIYVARAMNGIEVGPS